MNNNYELKLSYVVEQIVSQQTTTTTPAEKQIAKQNVGTTNVLNPNASLVFNGQTLTWMTNDTPIKQWNAISGLTVLNAKPNQWGNMLKRVTTTPEVWAKDKSMGPTPPGKYALGSLESRKGSRDAISKFKAAWLSVKDSLSGKWNEKTQDFNADTLYSQISWGNFRAPVIATKGTETFGRGGFYLHGGVLPGSHGCIDLTNQMDDFAKFYGTWLASTKKNSIPLTVNYGAKNEMVKEVWKATSNVPISGQTKTDTTKQTNTQPVSEPLKQPVTKPLPKQNVATNKPTTQTTGVKIYARLGDSGPVVSNFQSKLQAKNYNIGPKGADGKFGPDTYNALKKFQADNGLQVDGILGTETYNKLNGIQPPMRNEFM